MVSGEAEPDQREAINKPLAALDDVDDREELRGRYEMFLQETRVVLPGVQVLLGFLFTVPFAARFTELDRTERRGFGISLIGAFLAVLLFIAPSVFHRVGDRTARKARLRWGLRCSLTGFAALAIALIAAMWTVTRLIYGRDVAWILAVSFAVAILVVWLGLPLLAIRRDHSRARRAQLG